MHIKRILCIGLLAGSSLLSACSGQVGDVMKTASGALTEAKNRAQTAVEPIVNAAKDVEKRAEMVKEGIDDISAGKTKIQEGLKH